MSPLAQRPLGDAEGAGRHVGLRPADQQDAALLFAWRNDPATRAASHQAAPLAWESHLSWLRSALGAPDRHLWIGELEGRPVGTVRAERCGGAWRLSWTVAPEARGRGVGRALVTRAAARLTGPLRAEVKVGNRASQRIAEAAGLALRAEVDGVLYYERA